MACDFLNKSLVSLNKSSSPNARNWEECSKGLDEYSSDEELAQVLLFLDYPDALLKFAAACTCIFMILGIPGNIVTIVALSQYRKVRNATAIFIINMSVCDLLITCTILPIAISMFLNQSWTSGKMLCRVFSALSYTLHAASLFTIMAITINRYVLVSHPLQYPILYQTRNLVIMIIAIWVCAFLFIVPVLFEIWGRFSLDPKVGICTIIPDKNKNTPKIFFIITGFVIPCAVIIVCYSRIMWIVRKSSDLSTSNAPTTTKTIDAQSDSTTRNQEILTRELTSESTQEEENREDVKQSKLANLKKIFIFTSKQKQRVSTGPSKRDKRLQTMVSAIVMTYFASHLPFMFAEIALAESSPGPYVDIISYMLSIMRVCSDPIIYVIMSQEYRQAYKSVFGLLCKRLKC